MPDMLHKGPCTRVEIDDAHVRESVQLYADRMKHIVRNVRDKEEKEKQSNDAGIIATALTQAIEKMGQQGNRAAKIIKPANVPTWTKEMKWAVYLKALEAWIEQNNDMTEANRYQLITESLKQNREVSGLMTYMANHVLEVLDTVEEQTV